MIPERLLPLARDVIAAVDSCAFDVNETLDVWIDALLEAGLVSESPICHRKTLVKGAACRSCGQPGPGAPMACRAWVSASPGGKRTQAALAERDRERLRREATQHAYRSVADEAEQEGFRRTRERVEMVNRIGARR